MKMQEHFGTHPPLVLDKPLLKSMTQKRRRQKYSFLHPAIVFNSRNSLVLWKVKVSCRVAPSAQVSLSSALAKTSHLTSARIMLIFHLHICLRPLQDRFISMKDTFQTRVFNNNSFKNLHFSRHFQCSLSFNWYAL